MKCIKNIYLIIIFIFLLSSQYDLKIYCQGKSDTLNITDEVLLNRSSYDLMTLIINRQLEENVLSEGEYVKGDWDEVKQSKLPKTMYWSYPTGVTLLGMLRVYDIIKSAKVLDFVERNNRISADEYAHLRWQKMKFGKIYKTAGFEKLWRLEMLDDCGAMGAAILEDKLHHNVEFTSELNELVEIIGNYITNVQPRLEDGTFWRPNSPDGPTIWADDLYMSLPFLVRWSEYKNSLASLDDAAQQIINYASYLKDEDGVWFHAYFVDKKTHSCCKWGRANGWVAVAIAEVLSVLPKDNPNYSKVLKICKEQINGLIKYKSLSGLWYQVIDHPDLTWGPETSCTAQFAYAIARGVNKGWLDTSYMSVVERAFSGLKNKIDQEGGIIGVCRSTSIGNNLDYYNNRPTRYDDHHGNGLVLLALSEIYLTEHIKKFNKKTE